MLVKYFFFFVDAVVVVVGVSQKETARSVVFLDFSVKRRKGVGFCR